MAHQTSAIQRKQTTPPPIGRLMDADVSSPFFPVVFDIRCPWHSRRNGTCVTPVKGRKQNESRCNYKAAVALQRPVRNS